MPDRPPISLFVKLGYWDVYRLNVVLTATVFRKVLYVWSFVALLWLALSMLLLFRPSPEQDWAIEMQKTDPLKWALGLPVLFVFVLPLLSARRVVGDERVKRGVSYQFSDAGIHIETYVSKTDLLWTAIHRVSESRSSFLVFTNPNIASMVPKRCFGSTESVTEVREMFRAHVQKTKLQRN
jgi:hypothetical protein